MTERVFKLDQVKVKNITKLTDRGDKHLLRFTLFYPRPGTPKIETLKILQTKLQSNKMRSFTRDDFLKRIVFKENVVGEFLLRAEVIVVDRPSKVEAFLKKLFGGVLQFAIGRKIEGIGNVYLGKASEITNDALFEEEGDETLQVISKGEATLNAGTLDSCITIELEAPKTLKQTSKPQSNKGGKKHTTNAVLLKKGAPNGAIKLTLDAL
ncbi:MAG: hypothetical protein NXH95_14460 [Pseudomonadaceae bacterium]|nr:hypothetical protein [Pseudomonadaceae bacterium]